MAALSSLGGMVGSMIGGLRKKVPGTLEAADGMPATTMMRAATDLEARKKTLGGGLDARRRQLNSLQSAASATGALRGLSGGLV